MNPIKYSLSILLSAAFIMLAADADLSAQTGDKLTARARALIAASPQRAVNSYWIYFDAAAKDLTAPALSERALRRRAKVDPENYLLDERDYPIAESTLDAIRAEGAYISRVSRWLNAVSVEAETEQLARLERLPSVRRIDRAMTLSRPAPDQDLRARQAIIEPQADLPDYGSSLFQTQFINAVKLHQADLSGRGVMIAMFDNGFAVDHPVFDSTSILATYDFINSDDAVDEIECPDEASRNHQTSHGTQTLGVIGGNVPGSLIGVARHADFILAKTEITCGGMEIKVEEYNWIAAAEWADSAGADIVNSSLGYYIFQDSGSYIFDDLDGNTTLISQAADIAASKNILIVTSAGNERRTVWGHINAPADGDSVLAVGAVNPDSSLASFSSPGPSADGQVKPDITSLGVGVFTAYHLGGFASVNGTSFSSPLTAGGAALALEHDPTMTAMELLDMIRATGNRAENPDYDFGFGLFDAAAAADIIALIHPEQVTLEVDQQYTLDIETSGRTDSIPVLSAFNLPGWAQFTDYGDGTGSLNLLPDMQGAATTVIGLVADVGYFADTSYLTLRIIGNSVEPVYVGPNPLTDSIQIFIEPLAGHLSSTSIFNSLGEIVWEKVNNSPPTADLFIETWNGHNQSGEIVAAGVYLLVVKTDRQTFRIKLLKTN